MRTLLATSILLLTTACAPEQQASSDTDLFGAPEMDPDLQLTRSETEVSGTLLLDDGSVVAFRSVEGTDGTDVRAELNGMVLEATKTPQRLSMAGTTPGTDVPPLITEADRAALVRLTAALEAEFYPSIAHVTTKAEYDEVRHMTDAERALWSMVEGMWSQWPTSVPLSYQLDNIDIERGITERHYYADNSYNIGGSHDCWDCDWWESDCTDYKRIGHNFDGCNHGNSGTSCSGTQYTRDAINHDQCVRTSKHGGHSLASAWCDDQFASCVDDEISAFEAPYDWRGSSLYNACPTSWKGDNLCDVHCQFKDPDCPSS